MTKRPAWNDIQYPIQYESEAYITGSADGDHCFPFRGDRYGDDHHAYWNYRKGFETGLIEHATALKAVERAKAERERRNKIIGMAKRNLLLGSPYTAIIPKDPYILDVDIEEGNGAYVEARIWVDFTDTDLDPDPQ